MSNANASRHRMVGNVLDEVVRRERQQAQRIAELEAQVHYLRGYAIGKAMEVHELKHGVIPTKDEIRFIVGGIDGNMAVAGESAKGEGNETRQ